MYKSNISTSGRRSGTRTGTSRGSILKLSFSLLSKPSGNPSSSLTTGSITLRTASRTTTTRSTQMPKISMITTSISKRTENSSNTNSTKSEDCRRNAEGRSTISSRTEISSSSTASSLPSPRTWLVHVQTSSRAAAPSSRTGGS